MPCVSSPDQQEFLIGEAIREAQLGVESDGAPIGCVIARVEGADLTILARGFNEGNLTGNAVSHAEMVALGRLRSSPGGPLVLATTLEPCLMCFGGCLCAGISEIIYAQPALGDFGASRVALPANSLYPAPHLVCGIREEECQSMWRNWIADRQQEDLSFIRRLLGYV
jgi:tRNA(adenine34) deaminase